jgi:hypothetical protein
MPGTIHWPRRRIDDGVDLVGVETLLGHGGRRCQEVNSPVKASDGAPLA